LKIYEIVFWEVILILASVFMFRGAWMLLDRILGTGILWLWTELIIGIVVAAISLYALNKRVK